MDKGPNTPIPSKASKLICQKSSFLTCISTATPSLEAGHPWGGRKGKPGKTKLQPACQQGSVPALDQIQAQDAPLHHEFHSCTTTHIFVLMFQHALLLLPFFARLVYFNWAIFVYFASPPYALLSATHIFSIPFSNWELIPLWVACTRTSPIDLLPDFSLVIYLFLILPDYVFYLAALCRDFLLVF